MSVSFYVLLHLAGLVLLTLSLGGMIALKNAGTETRPKVLMIFHGVGLFLLLLAGFGMLAKLSIGFPWPGWIWVKIAMWASLGAFPRLSSKFDAGMAWYVVALLIVVAAAMAVLKPF